jgi:hypothetical protein
MKFESFKLNARYLLAFNRIKSKLYGFSLDCLLSRFSFDKYEFEIKVVDLTLYGSTRDCKFVFTIENSKLLQFYKCNENKAIKKAEIPLYIETKQVKCSDDFLILAMKDRRIISFFMYDEYHLEESYEKIRQLESR